MNVSVKRGDDWVTIPEAGLLRGEFFKRLDEEGRFLNKGMIFEATKDGKQTEAPDDAVPLSMEEIANGGC